VVLRMLLSLARLERAWVTLKGLQLRQPVVGVEGLVQVRGWALLYLACLRCSSRGCGGRSSGSRVVWACALSLGCYCWSNHIV